MLNGLLQVILPTGFTAVLILAQAAIPGIDSGIAQLIGTVGTGAVLVWYVVYDVRTRTPEMLRSFAVEQAAAREAFTKEQDATHLHYTTIVEGLRQTFVIEQNAMRQTFTVEQAALRTRHEKEVAELRDMLFENMKAMRGAVHDVKTTANALMTHKPEVQA